MHASDFLARPLHTLDICCWLSSPSDCAPQNVRPSAGFLNIFVLSLSLSLSLSHVFEKHCVLKQHTLGGLRLTHSSLYLIFADSASRFSRWGGTDSHQLNYNFAMPL